MNKFNISGLILLVVFLVPACRKATTPPETAINILQPFNNQIYHTADTVYIQGNIKHYTQLHGYQIMILNQANDTLFFENEHAHGTLLHFDKVWVNQVSATETLRVIVVCVISHDGLKVDKELRIQTRP